MRVASTEIYGPFEVLERLGVGGMATVHRAIERCSDGRERVVALKRLLPHLAEDEGFVRSFVREAKLASLLRHGNIVEIYELGRVGASYFISMEYIAGRDLRVIMRQARRICGPPPIRVALALVAALLEALDYAHSKCDASGMPLGLVHRDISPANLIVSHTGDLKVIDFGIARATLGYLMTHTARVKGKLSYMAPEALAGKLVDGRSDLFSATVIAHELLTATPLFAAKDDFTIIERLQSMLPPPPSAMNPGCPPGLDDIVRRGLAKNPAERWRSAAEMRAALEKVAIGEYALAGRGEVCDWVEEAFEIHVPSSSSPSLPAVSSLSSLTAAPTPSTSVSRRRFPLAQSSIGQAGWMARQESAAGHVPGQGNPAGQAAEEEIVEMVWGAGGQGLEVPVVLDDVPDVSSRPSTLGSGRVRSPMRGEPFDAADPTEPLDPVALGTAPTMERPAQQLLAQAVSAARRAEAIAMAAASRQRPSLLLILVALGVAAAGTTVAWTISRATRRRPAPVVVAEPPLAQVKAMPPGWQGAAAPPPAPVPAPGAGQPAALVTPPPPAPVPAAVLTGPDKDARAAAATDVVRDPRRDPGKRRLRGELTGRTVPPADDRERQNSRDGEDRSHVPPGGPLRVEETGAKPAAAGQEVPAAPPPEPVPGWKQEPVEQPARIAPAPPPAPSSPPRRKGPITIPASRVKRESGGRPIRFPAGEQVPRTVVAKLCIDPSGGVTTVTVLSRVSLPVRNAIERALVHWRYQPIVEDDERVAACFATSFPILVE